MKFLRFGSVAPLLLFFCLIFTCLTSPGLQAEPSEEYKKLYAEAVNLYGEKKYEDVLKQLEQAIALQPDQVAAYELTGATYVGMKEYSKAEEYFKRVLEITPERPTAMFNYAETLFLQKKYKESKQQFQNFLAVEGNSKNALGRYKVILCDILLGNDAEARQTVQNLKPTISHPLKYYALAALYFDAGEDQEARSYLQSSFSIYPGGLNLAFAESLVDIGWLKDEEIPDFGALSAAALMSLSTEFHPEVEETKEASSLFESILPSLDEEEKKE